jgi:hypothetical protein
MRGDPLLDQGQVGTVLCRKQRGPVGAVPVVGVLVVAFRLSAADVRESVDSGNLVVGQQGRRLWSRRGRFSAVTPPSFERNLFTFFRKGIIFCLPFRLSFLRESSLVWG